MNLTRIKASTLDFSSGGIIQKELNVNTNSSGNYWIDWADLFIKNICIEQLGLEVEKGPGTSIGIIHRTYGPVRYQYDCDWNKTDGRVSGFDEYERGFTFWEGTNPWNYDGEVPEDLSKYGIDKDNKRFDFIVWFTSESLDSRNGKEGERLGLRFKYPLTSEMGYGTACPIGAAPACIPWKKVKSDNNNYHLNENKTLKSNRTDAVTYSNLGYIILGNYDIVSGTQIWNSNWIDYNENGDNEKEKYNRIFPAGNNIIPYYGPSAFRNGTTKIDILYSNDYSTINLKMYREVTTTNNNTTSTAYYLLFDIIYGDLLEEKLGDFEYTTNSFVMIKNANLNNDMSNFLITENNYIFNPKKQVNRPVSLDNSIQTYCGISRLLLQQEPIHCQSLYQVFSFNSLMDTNNYIRQVFEDKNGDSHTFLLFNYGGGTTSEDRMKSVCLAIPISNNS